MGEWPISPITTSNGDLPGIGGPVRTEAYYVKPEEIAGDIEWRLKRTGIAGTQLVEEIEAMEDLDYQKLHSLARDALNYISGWSRKRLSYSAWLKQRRYRLKR